MVLPEAPTMNDDQRKKLYDSTRPKAQLLGCGDTRKVDRELSTWRVLKGSNE